MFLSARNFSVVVDGSGRGRVYCVEWLSTAHFTDMQRIRRRSRCFHVSRSPSLLPVRFFIVAKKRWLVSGTRALLLFRLLLFFFSFVPELCGACLLGLVPDEEYHSRQGHRSVGTSNLMLTSPSSVVSAGCVSRVPTRSMTQTP